MNKTLLKRARVKKGLRKKYIRNLQNGRLRLCVYRSNNEIYAQIVDDNTGKTLFSASSLKLSKEEKKLPKSEQSKIVGKIIAKKAKENGKVDVYFDRNGFLYHGRIKSLADSARENGLNF